MKTTIYKFRKFYSSDVDDWDLLKSKSKKESIRKIKRKKFIELFDQVTEHHDFIHGLQNGQVIEINPSTIETNCIGLGHENGSIFEIEVVCQYRVRGGNNDK